MTLDAELLEILVCPNDRGEIDYLEDQQVIVCRTCGYRYPVRDDIPVMLIDEAEKPAGRAGDGDRPRRPAGPPDGRPAGHARRRRGAARATSAPRTTSGRARRRAPRRRRRRRRSSFCGMGGSAVAGDVLRTLFRERLAVPVEVNRSPGPARPTRPAHARRRARRTRGTPPRRSRRSARRSSEGAGSWRSRRAASSATTCADARRSPVGARSRRASSRARRSDTWRSRSLGALEAVGLLPPLAADVAETAPRCSSALCPTLGPDVPTADEPREDAAAWTRRPRPGHLGRRRHRRRGRDAMEDPDERERQGARPGRSRCPSSITTRWWAGPTPYGRRRVRDRAAARRRAPRARGPVPAVADIARDAGADVDEVGAAGAIRARAVPVARHRSATSPAATWRSAAGSTRRPWMRSSG